MKIIHIDLDGVLADFDGHYKALFGAVTTDEKMWQNINSNPTYFLDMPPMEDSFQLLKYVYQIKGVEYIRILTATGWRHEHVSKQKVAWCAKHWGYDPNYITTVRKSEHKAWFASPNAILIDDSERSINPWVKAGGIGILHVNTKHTIRDLNELYGL